MNLAPFRSCLQNPFLVNLCRRMSSSVNNFTNRTHTCGELNASHVGEEVTLCGWTTFERCDKFIILRDKYGFTQIIFNEIENLSKKFVKSLPLESVIQVKGIVKKRPPKDFNKRLPTGEIEVEAKDIKLLNASIPRLPITSKDQEKINETTNYKYRYLSLRSSKLQENLRIRSSVLMKMREFLHNQHGFVDIETPTLFKRTPGGAKEFIVPTKFPGKFYSLVQSPQQFKQLLMIGLFDRYFQIARCYRNEGTKADRQPEFTQVDIELSYTSAKDIQNLIEQLIKYSWPVEKGEVQIPFKSIKYEEAMHYYGTDKPDLRYDMKLKDVTDELKNSELKIASESKHDPEFMASCLVVPNGTKFIKSREKKEIHMLADSLPFSDISVKEDLSWSSAISKHLSIEVQQRISSKLSCVPGDLILLAAGKRKHILTFLGKARVKSAEYLLLKGADIMQSDVLSFVWVTDFPLFLQDDNGTLESAHHPFTAPHPDDIELVYTTPLKARSQHYDLVLNGQEIGGGSIRIHDANLQKYVLEEVLKEDSSELQHLLDALSSGCPPHGGIALGIDRLLSLMCGCRSITEVIAFPKSLDGKDLMSGAPCPISAEDKKLYHIEPVLPDNEKTEQSSIIK
ncbi:aspartate--tRNA ligase, mitochondrial-like [Argiope bruennichi]|uniref:aspartate--tRNA ligase, mitochondrial-like n=1 Tax=Argiope bruennichi TaxID=94029 RepID=UPI002494C005|nr:aspartate--tRNA ligase, mitochondrial-like [Argiope bruennichi]